MGGLKGNDTGQSEPDGGHGMKWLHHFWHIPISVIKSRPWGSISYTVVLSWPAFRIT